MGEKLEKLLEELETIDLTTLPCFLGDIGDCEFRIGFNKYYDSKIKYISQSTINLIEINDQNKTDNFPFSKESELDQKCEFLLSRIRKLSIDEDYQSILNDQELSFMATNIDNIVKKYL